MSAVPQQSIPISNAEFLRGIFHEFANDAHVTGFADPPDAIGDRKVWAGRRFKGRDLNPEHNNYFVISTFSMLNENGRTRAVRRKAQFLAGHCVVVDDVGTKVKDTERLPPPSWRLETSTGNEQWGYILDKPCTDGALFSGTLALMVAKGLSVDGTDPGMKGVTRYVRLPVGRNRKSKYAPLGLVCNLHEWQPERTYSLARLLAEFDATEDDARALAEGVGSAARTAAPADDFQLRAIERAGKYRGPIGGKPGVHDIECPWLEDHSDGDDSGTAVFTLADGRYGFKCHHGHCNDKTFNDVAAWLQERNITGFEAVQVPDGPPAPAKPSLARPLGDTSDYDFDVVYHLIDNVLPVGGLTMLWGESTAGKSFLAIDWALHLVYGREWNGHKVRPSKVWYMAGEGEIGLKKRVVAWRKFRNIAEPTGPRFMIHNLKHVTAFEALNIDAYDVPQCDLIVIDTLNRWSQGNENDSAEMGAWLRVAQRLSVLAGGAAVLIVHHARKDGDQYRGSTAIKAAVDAEFEISGTAEAVTITHRKSKDEEMLPEMTLMKRTVRIGEKDDGFGGTKVHTSLVFELPTNAEQGDVQDELAERVIQALRQVRGECSSQNDLAALVKGKRALINAKIGELIDRKVIERVGRYGLKLRIFEPVQEPSIWD